MATESPIRMLETSGKWPSPKETATFAPSSSSMAAEELSLLLTDHRFFGNGRDVAPNRSGSAPPSMEGSFAAIENLMSPQNSSLNARYANLNSLIENCEPEEQLRADPAYLAYYCSKINLNPRLPPPLISWENRRLVRHIGSFGNSRGLTSLDDSGGRSLRLSQGTLSTHKEESEDDRSPQKPSDDWEDQSSAFWSGQDAAFLAGQHRSSVDLIQDDFPRTPSPVYNQSRSLIHGSPGKTVEHDADSSSLHDSSVGTSNLVASTLVTDNLGPSSNANPAIAPVSNSLSLDGTGSTPPSPALIERDAHNLDVHLEDDVLIGGITVSDFVSTESKMKDSNTSSLPNSGNKKNQEDWHHNRQKNWLQHQVHQQQGNSFQVQGAKSQMVFQGTNHTNINMDQYLHGSSKFSTEAQPVLQSSGFTPPLYATAAAYMTSANPFYPNLQPPGLFSPQYSFGGFALNTAVLPPFVAGYPPHGAIPLAFDNTVGPSFNAQTSAVSTGESITQAVDMQHLNKFYGQLGYAPQPSFADPLYMQYFQQPFGDVYSVSGQFDPLVSRGGVIGSQVSAFETHRESDVASCSVDKKLQHQRSGGLTNLNHRRGGIASPNYHGSPTNMGMLMQFPTSPLASPVLPRSPAGVTCLPGGRNEIRYPPGSGKNVGIFSGWQGQRGYDDPKTHSFLEELKSGKGRRFELSDIAGHIVEFSADQHGSRFIQQKLENCSVEEKASVFKEVLPHASKLMTDVFGNYVIQKFFEHGNPEQRKELASQLAGQILPLSLQMYGCRVIQKALDVIELEQKTLLVRELDGHVMRCVRDQNGNHVIQKCIESVPTEKIGFIISAFRSHVATLSTHPYGCRVIQRVLEHCTDELQSQFIVDEILESICSLAQDQYGNYVTQHVLERGKPHERSQIINKLKGHIVQLSQHKFASNVVEKCLEYGDVNERGLLIEEIIGHNEGNDNLLIMMKDQFANYVIQKILDICTDNQRESLFVRIRVHAHALKKYTYGKHIVSRFEQLFGEEIEAS